MAARNDGWMSRPDMEPFVSTTPIDGENLNQTGRNPAAFTPRSVLVFKFLQHRVALRPGWVRVGKIQVIVQAPAFGSLQRAAHDQFRHGRDVAQLQQISRHDEIPVIVVDLLPANWRCVFARVATACSCAQCQRNPTSAAGSRPKLCDTTTSSSAFVAWPDCHRREFLNPEFFIRDGKNFNRRPMRTHERLQE